MTFPLLGDAKNAKVWICRKKKPLATLAVKTRDTPVAVVPGKVAPCQTTGYEVPMDPTLLAQVERLTRDYDIPTSELAKLVRLTRTSSLSKRAYFVEQGSQPDRLAMIQTGIFRVVCLTEAGEEKTLAFRRPGQFLAAYTPYLEKRESWYSIQALTEAELVHVPLTAFDALVQGHPSWERLVKDYIVQLLIEKEDRERSFLTEDATTRYRRFLANNPELETEIAQSHIASYLGISPVSLSRIRAQLKKAGELT